MTTFAELGIVPAIWHPLAADGMSDAFPIQQAAIPDILDGRNVLGKAPTGSGKTLAFGLPLIQRLLGAASRPGAPRAIIVAPTRELAQQIAGRLEPLTAGLRLICVVGGTPIARDKRRFASSVDIVVATPGRLLDLMAAGTVRLDEVEISAVDEADEMASMGFIPDMRRILAATPSDAQRLLFSATLDGQVGNLVDEFVHHAVTHELEVEHVDTMTHYVLNVHEKSNKLDIIRRIGAREGRTIMFVRVRYAVDKFVAKLRACGVPAVGIHGDKDQKFREKALRHFAEGRASVFVATDVAARGLDISHVDLVVHIDPPADHKAYVHRAGRTARGGESGTVITLMTDDQTSDVAALMKAANIQPTMLDARADEKQWVELTGARTPSGVKITITADGVQRVGSGAGSQGGSVGRARGRSGSRRHPERGSGEVDGSAKRNGRSGRRTSADRDGTAQGNGRAGDRRRTRAGRRPTPIATPRSAQRSGGRRSARGSQ